MGVIDGVTALGGSTEGLARVLGASVILSGVAGGLLGLVALSLARILDRLAGNDADPARTALAAGVFLVGALGLGIGGHWIWLPRGSRWFDPEGLLATALVVAAAGAFASFASRSWRLRRGASLGLRAAGSRPMGAALLLVGLSAILGIALDRPALPPEDGGPEDLDRPVTVERPWNVVLVVVDTLRADRLGCYGFEAARTPRIDRFAAEGIRFEWAYSTSSWSVPGHASLFTGRWPGDLAAIPIYSELSRLPIAEPGGLLAETLRDHGYWTAAACANALVGPVTGMDRGFAVGTGFRAPGARPSHLRVWRALRLLLAPVLDPAAGHGLVLGEQITGGALRYLDRAAGAERPFFLFLNYMDVPDRIWVDPEGPSAYDRAVADVDAEVGRVLDAIDAGSLADRTLVIVTADHGESIGDGARHGHAESLDEGEVRVPLLVRLPEGRRRGEVVVRPVTIADIAPTIHELIGVAPPGPVHGRSLLGEEERPILLELGTSSGERWLACRSGRYKLVVAPDGARRLLDLQADPKGSVDVRASHEDDARRIEAELWTAAGAARRDSPDGGGRSAEDLERELRSMGYVGD